jgi:hypothetical protein
MALKKTVITPHGFKAENAYHRVENVKLQNKNTILFHVRSYKDSTSCFFHEQFVSCSYEIDGENPIKQAYEYLKTTKEFSTAEDI